MGSSEAVLVIRVRCMLGLGALLAAGCTDPASAGQVAPASARAVVDVGSAPFRGPADAGVTLVEFADFECPYCGQEEGVLGEILKAYPSQVRLVYKEFPLTIHTYAEGAAEAALAANAQGKFWPYHDTLFAHQDALTTSDLTRYASSLALDVATFSAALQQGTYRVAVEADVAQGNSVGVEGTPTLFVNGRAAVGALPFNTLAAAIDEELGATKAP